LKGKKKGKNTPLKKAEETKTRNQRYRKRRGVECGALLPFHHPNKKNKSKDPKGAKRGEKGTKWKKKRKEGYRRMLKEANR